MLSYSCSFQRLKWFPRAVVLDFNLTLNVVMFSFQIGQSSFTSFQDFFAPLNIMVECRTEVYTTFCSFDILLDSFVERANAISSKELNLLRVGKMFGAFLFNDRILNFAHLTKIILQLCQFIAFGVGSSVDRSCYPI